MHDERTALCDERVSRLACSGFVGQARADSVSRCRTRFDPRRAGRVRCCLALDLGRATPCARGARLRPVSTTTPVPGGPQRASGRRPVRPRRPLVRVRDGGDTPDLGFRCDGPQGPAPGIHTNHDSDASETVEPRRREEV